VPGLNVSHKTHLHKPSTMATKAVAGPSDDNLKLQSLRQTGVEVSKLYS